MSGTNQFGLLKERRFLPFFLTQTLGALNDNIFKNGLVILMAFLTVEFDQAKINHYTNLAAGLFILPFFLFSATSGQLADKFDKARLAQAVKILEIAIMLGACFGFLNHNVPWLLAMLFMMGLHSTVFGPLKYGILPQLLHRDELVGGNALVEMATFFAILIGTLLGAILIRVPGNGPWILSLTCIAVAVAGLGCALAMPRMQANAPNVRINWNPISETVGNLRYIKSNRTIFLSCLGISWFWFYGSMYFTQLPAYAKQVLGGSPDVYTLLLALFSVGVGIGSLLCEKLSGKKVEIGLVPFGSIGMTLFGVDLYFAKPDAAAMHSAAGLLEFIAQPYAWRAMFDLTMMAVFSGFYIVPLFALIQTRCDPARCSRVIASNNIMNAMFMVAASVIAVGLLNFAGLDIPQLLLATAIMNAVVAIYIYTLVPEFLMRFLSWILIHLFYRIRVEGVEKIPEHGAALIVCNHVSFMDPLIVAGIVRRPIRFVMYWKIFNIPVLNWIFRTARAIPIAGKKENETLMEKAFAEVDRELGAGEIAAIFPEGGITDNGEIKPFRPGVERILAQRPVPVIPMALRGMWGSMFSRHDSTLGRLRIPRRFRSRIALVIGDPIPPELATAAYLEQRVRELRGDWA